jgi:transcriptional regulator with XRE-family HTH domain
MWHSALWRLTLCRRTAKISCNVRQQQGRLTLEALRRTRVDAGLTISELAKRAGVSRDTISNAERGRHSLQGPTLSKIARALGKAPSELLAEEERLFPKAKGHSSLEPSLFNGGEDERRSPLSPWAEYARRMADRIRVHNGDANSPAFRDPWAALFFVEEKNREAAELYALLFEEEMDQEPYGDEPLAALEDPLSAFEDLAEALTEARERADRMGAGRTETDLDRRRQRAAEATTERERLLASISSRLERPSA